MSERSDDEAPGESAPKRRFPRLVNTSVATRLSLVALVVTLVSLGVTATVGLTRGNQLADEIADDQMVSVAAARGSTVEVYTRSVRREISSLAASPGTAASIESFAEAYRELATTPQTPEQTDALTEHYLTEVLPPIGRARGDLTGVGLTIPQQSGAIQLQFLYSIPDEPEDGGAQIDPSLVVDAGDGSTYSEVHAQLHRVYGSMAAASDFDDLFLISNDGDTIVYSVRKRSDFATSLDVGPLSGTSLATLIDRLEGSSDDGLAAVVDFAPYGPVGDQPRMFVADRVLGPDGEPVGYVAASLATDPFDRIMSGSGGWRGFGETGDAYLVGPDATLRTTPRAYSEDPAAFLAEPEEPSAGDLTQSQRRQIRATGTPALVQPVDPALLELPETGNGVTQRVNYRSADVLTAARTVRIEGLEWVSVAEIEMVEINEPNADFARNVLIAVALFVVVVTFVAVRWSERIVAPIRSIAGRLRAVRGASEDADGGVELEPKSPNEYVDLATNIDSMLDRLADRRAAAEARATERADIVAEFLPAGAVQRTVMGDDVLDHVANATVAALAIDGLGLVVHDAGEQAERDLLATVIDQLDELTLEFGLERVKATGTRYYAVCGVGRPYLDHALRSVGFALAAVELVRDLAAEHHAELALRAAVDSGHVSVGLTGRGGLVYDAWGEAVSHASELVRHSAGGAIAVSRVVRGQLPDDFLVIDGDPDDDVVIVTGRVGEVTT